MFYIWRKNMRKLNRVICDVPSKVKELIMEKNIPSRTRRDKNIFAAMVKQQITFPAQYAVSDSDPEMIKVMAAYGKKDIAKIGFSLSDFDYEHLETVSRFSFRSIIQQSALALCSMAIYMKKNKIKSYRLEEDFKIIFNSN